MGFKTVFDECDIQDRKRQINSTTTINHGNMVQHRRIKNVVR